MDQPFMQELGAKSICHFGIALGLSLMTWLAMTPGAGVLASMSAAICTAFGLFVPGWKYPVLSLLLVVLFSFITRAYLQLARGV